MITTVTDVYKPIVAECADGKGVSNEKHFMYYVPGLSTYSDILKKFMISGKGPQFMNVFCATFSNCKPYFIEYCGTLIIL